MKIKHFIVASLAMMFLPHTAKTATITVDNQSGGNLTVIFYIGDVMPGFLDVKNGERGMYDSGFDPIIAIQWVSTITQAMKDNYFYDNENPLPSGYWVKDFNLSFIILGSTFEISEDGQFDASHESRPDKSGNRKDTAPIGVVPYYEFPYQYYSNPRP